MKVSVIIPAYNHAAYVATAINSVLEQSFDDFELIIINDGSTDKTEDEIVKFDDSRIIYVSQKNQGAHNTINKGIELAKGEYISILNSDDIYDSSRLEKCVAFLDNNKDYSVVITEVEGINKEGLAVNDIRTAHIAAWLNWYSEALSYCENKNFLLCSFAYNLLITTSNYFMRKDVLKLVGTFSGLRYAHDWHMLLRLLQCCDVHIMREALLKYRIHDSNTVHEDNSESKVKFEVNWLIAENLRHLKKDIDLLELMGSIKRNHYINMEVLALLLMINDDDKFKMLLDFNNCTTLKAMEFLR